MVTCFITFVIAGLCSLKYIGVCSELPQYDDKQDDLFKVVTSKMFEKEGMSFIENTENDTHSNLENSSEDEYIPKMELVVSGPLFEDMLWNTSNSKEMNRKRGAPERGLSHELEMQILQLHNIYRSNVTPPAADMAYMEWDAELARFAQNWSDGCIFEHGYPESSSPGDMTQNLYMGTDPTGSHGIWLWYEEYKNYNIQKMYCIPGKVCGHYVAMAWAESNKVGCGMARCKNRYYLTCYYTPGAFDRMQIYRIAKPCSQCSSKTGALCLKNLCMTKEQCNRNPFECKFAKCELECLNCGRLDKQNCMCECADGWDTPDCSILCANKVDRCGKSPGYPNKSLCPMGNYTVANKYCRKMCEKCKSVTEFSEYTCCNGTLCDEGYVLDTDEELCKGPCHCKLLCPGPKCEQKDEDSNHNCCNATLCEDGYVLDAGEGLCQCKCASPVCEQKDEDFNSNPCNATLCEDGYVLDTDEGSCQCKCADPMCDGKEKLMSQASLGSSSAGYSRLDFVLLVWIFVTWTFLKMNTRQILIINNRMKYI